MKRTKCKACQKYFNNYGREDYCSNCDPNGSDYRSKFHQLLEHKQELQSLEERHKKSHELWRKYGEEVRQLGQLIGQKRKDLIDKIK